ncbi:hypothetical protein IFM89_018705 [Coptis chinensis]|uniref:RING-type E3 ubiquitin transferase n=1 Tax=Coptis chinensis TaxID=261450 RepID=A0A835HID7_9MAGN|nr:hypothetical protein IFM89_018705 [Coptis chinensis]
MQKARTQAASEAAAASKRISELETKRQKGVEMKALTEAAAKTKVLTALPNSNIRHRRDQDCLEERLFRKGGTPTIPWWTRFKIAAENATGLLFINQTKPEPLVHRDLKPSNILLDHNHVTKIIDVGLARLFPPSVANTSCTKIGCRKKVIAKGDHYWCNNCNNAIPSPDARYQLKARIQDDTESTLITIFGDEAEELLKHPASDLARLIESADGIQTVKAIMDEIIGTR